MAQNSQDMKAKESAKRLFADPTFEPQWMTSRREAERQALEDDMTIGVPKSWDKTAAMSRKRIAEKYPSRRRVRDWEGFS